MSSVDSSTNYFIGWDVGGWNCDKNPRSRDSLVILDQSLAMVGQPWRGNLRRQINAAETTQDFMETLFELCDADEFNAQSQVCMAIDTPLGFSDEFVRLVTQLKNAGPIKDSASNPYLFRKTEHFLFEHGLTPLSAVKDMIGSQSTKGMHALAKFAPAYNKCGMWTDNARLTAIEAYPSACRSSALMQQLRDGYEPLGHEDKEDALTCALVAYLFAERPNDLLHPSDSVPTSEGWIWVPTDALAMNKTAKDSVA